MVEEKASKVVVPLTQKSGEHKGEQNHFRAERRQCGIPIQPTVKEDTAPQGFRMSCFGLPTVERLRKEEREDRVILTKAIPVKKKHEKSVFK
jgi:hypothetical protein